MANLAAIFANKGWYYDPHVVRAVGDPDSVLTTYRVKHQVEIDPKWFDHIHEGMRRVVNEAGGTARQARIPGVNVWANRDRRESARSGSCCVHRIRTNGRSEDRDRGLRENLFWW